MAKTAAYTRLCRFLVSTELSPFSPCFRAGAKDKPNERGVQCTRTLRRCLLFREHKFFQFARTFYAESQKRTFMYLSLNFEEAFRSW